MHEGRWQAGLFRQTLVILHELRRFASNDPKMSENTTSLLF